MFLVNINVNAFTLQNSSLIFFWVSGKLPPGKFPPMKLPPVNATWNIHTQKVPTWNISTHVFKYPRLSFLFFYFIIVTVFIDVT